MSDVSVSHVLQMLMIVSRLGMIKIVKSVISNMTVRVSVVAEASA